MNTQVIFSNTGIPTLRTIASAITSALTYFIVVSVVAIALAIPTQRAVASVNLDPTGHIKLFGDVRLRSERDGDTKQSGETRDRERIRFRARLGTSFKANDKWSGRMRFSTESNALNSPHQSFGTGDPRNNSGFGIDQAFIAYTGINNLSVVGGKTPLNFWQQTEVFWDNDINPEALAVTYKLGSVTLNSAYITITEGNWDDDLALGTYQAVYQDKIGNMQLTVAAGGALLDNAQSDPDTSDDGLGDGLHAKSHLIGSAQLRTGPWLLGADYLQSDAASENIAYVAQARYKVSKTLGLRVYYYSVETFATPGDGLFTQDNFGSAESSADNFTGYRLQIDYQLGHNTSMNLRYYDADIITAGVDGQSRERSRLQLNFDIKF